MLSLFTNRKKQKAGLQQAMEDKFLKPIVHDCLKWQSTWAEWMQKKAEKLSGKGKLMVLLVFVLLAGGYSIYLIGRSFSENQTPSFSIISIKRPANIQETGDELKHTNAILSKSEYERIHQFRQYMDSLVVSASGKTLHDSIVALRPGLMDSIQVIENMYQSQIKK
jgi:hypothetical protein